MTTPNKIKVAAGHYEIPSPSEGFPFVIRQHDGSSKWTVYNPYGKEVADCISLKRAVSKAYLYGAVHP